MDDVALFSYQFPLDPISRVRFDSPKLFEFLEREEPVVIEGSGMILPAIEKWDLDYLLENLGSQGEYNVMQTIGHQKFMFYDQKRCEMLKGKIEFVPESTVLDMGFPEFVKRYFD